MSGYRDGGREPAYFLLWYHGARIIHARTGGQFRGSSLFLTITLHSARKFPSQLRRTVNTKYMLTANLELTRTSEWIACA